VYINLGYFILFINLILLIKGFSKNGKPFKIFAFYCGVMFVVQMSAKVLVELHQHNLFLSHFYFVLQFIILSFFYYYLMKESIQKKIIVLSLLVCLSLLVFQYAFNWRIFFKFNLFEIFITSLPIIIFATFHLYNMLNSKREFYYINIGLLIYLFGSTIVFLTANLLISLKAGNAFKSINSLNIYLYVVYQLFILYDLVTALFDKNKNNNERYRIN
jgi:hypothetical protein